MAYKLLIPRILSKTQNYFLHASSPFDSVPTTSIPHCLRTLHSFGSNRFHSHDDEKIRPSNTRSVVTGSVPRSDLAEAVSSAFDADKRVPVTVIAGFLGSGKIWRNEHISPFYRYKPLHAGMQAFPRWFTVKAQKGAAMHQDIVQSQLHQLTEKDKTRVVDKPDYSDGEEGGFPRAAAFSPLEGSYIKERASALRNDSSEAKRPGRIQYISAALIPTLILVSKTKLTTSLLILSATWHMYIGIKEIMLDYVHQEMSREWILIYFKLLLIFMAKEIFLGFNMG